MTLLLLALVVVALAGIAVVEAAIRNSTVGFVVAMAPFVLDAATTTDVFVAVGPINISPGDLSSVVIATAFAARLLRARKISVMQWLVLGVLAFGAISLARGVPMFGVQTSFNEFRDFFALTTNIGYASTLEPRPELLARFGRVWFGLALVLTGISFMRWIANAAGLTGEFFGRGEDLRVLNAPEALVVVQGVFVVLLAMEEDDDPRWRRLAILLSLTALLLQHRTTWMVAIFTTLLVVARRRELGRRLLGAAVVGAVVLGALVMTVGTGSFRIQEELEDSATNPDTLEWRIAGWQALFRDAGPKEPVDVVFGRPFGAGWDRRYNGIVVDVTPHNQYIETFLRTGVVGLLIFGTLVVTPLRVLRRRGRGGGLMTSETLFLLIAGMPVYVLTYDLPEVQGLIIGVGIAAAGYHTLAPGSSGAQQEVRDEVEGGVPAA